MPKLRRWHLFVVIVAAAIGANYQRLPWVWAEIFYRNPAPEWIRATAVEKLPGELANGKQLSFQITQTTPLREAAGVATVTVTGTAATREPLYEAVAVSDPSLGLDGKLHEQRLAEERAQFLHDGAGIDVKPVDQNAFRFVRETTPIGARVPFEMHFKARRDEMQWHLDKIVSVSLNPATALPGKPIADFTVEGATPSVIGTDKAKQDIAELSSRIDRYVTDVREAEKAALKRFAAEGRDANGNFLFPPDRAMPGERFAETRMRVMQSEEVQDWPEEKLQYAINEVFARHGAKFGNKKLFEWFSQFTWYKPQANITFEQIENSLPDIELQNLKTIGYVRTIKRQNAIEQQRAAAEQQRRTLAAQRAQEQQAAAAQKAQQEAALRAQQEQAAQQLVGGLLQGIIDSIPK